MVRDNATGFNENIPMTPKEKLFEELVKPLMDQVFDLCSEHNIAMQASFGFKHRENNGTIVTLAVLDEQSEPAAQMIMAHRLADGEADDPLRVLVDIVAQHGIPNGMSIVRMNEDGTKGELISGSPLPGMEMLEKPTTH